MLENCNKEDAVNSGIEVEMESDELEKIDVPFRLIACNRYAGMMICTIVVGVLCFFYFEPVLAINLVSLGMKESLTGLGFAAIAFSFALACPILGYLSTVINRSIVVNASMLVISISVFFIGPS